MGVARTAAAASVGAVALLLVATLSSDGVRRAAASSLKSAGSGVHSSFGGEASELAALCEECACSSTESRLFAAADSARKLDETTPAPTQVEDWVVLWTEGTGVHSYVWVMENEYEGIKASVLVDTTGRAQGVTLAMNLTTVNFVDESGAVYAVDVSGFDKKELVDYCAQYSEDDECQGMGLDYWDYSEKLYFADAKLGYLMSCDHNGDNLQIMVSGIDQAYGVSVDTKAGQVYFTAGGLIYSVSYTALGLTMGDVAVTTFYTPEDYYVWGLTLDSEYRYVYWTGDDTVFRMPVDYVTGDAPETIYEGVGCNSVSTDWEQDILFYTDDDGLHIGNLDGTKQTRVAAYLYNTTFVYIKYEVTPTPSPTSVPSSAPSFKPTDAPTAAPSPKPTTLPTPKPTTLPTASPSSAPSSAPAPAPTSSPSPVPAPAPTSKPSSAPVPAPTNKPSSMPTPHPSALPSSSPSSAPSPKPTTLPTPKPTKLPTASPSSAPSSAPAPAPTSSPSSAPVPAPTSKPSSTPTSAPVPSPTTKPSSMPTPLPSSLPSSPPTSTPTPKPTTTPTTKPSSLPTMIPTSAPTPKPTSTPTASPSLMPSAQPTMLPTLSPTTVCDWWYGHCDMCGCAAADVVDDGDNVFIRSDDKDGDDAYIPVAATAHPPVTIKA